VRAWEGALTIPTYAEGLPDPNQPFDFFEPRRVNYPYTIRNNLTDRRASREWRTLNLENEYLHCVILPDLGGHLYSCTDKINGADVFYANPSIKLTQIGYRGAWAALGIEFNFPVSHNWMTTSPIDYAITTNNDGSASVWIANIDRVYGMQWRVQLTLRPGRAELEQHTTLYNRSDYRHRFYWWTNAAVEVWDDSRVIYPMRFTASHGFRDIDTWPVDSRGTDNSTVGNHMFGPVSRFSHGSREPYMAVYNPRTNAGVVHYSSPFDLPAKKVWSWGGNPNGVRWRRALSDDNSAYVEIQRGLFRNQETYGFLESRESVSFSEYWIPIRDIGWVSRANRTAVAAITRVALETNVENEAAIDVAVNVTRAIPGATILLRDVRRIVSGDRVDLTPDETFRKRYDEVLDDEVYTLEIRDASDSVVFRHTENLYDYTPADEIDVGPVAAYQYPAVDNRTEGDWLSYGDWLEREGRLLDALANYRDGLDRFSNSVALHKAAGRLAVAVKRYEPAVGHLSYVLDRVSNDYEAAYYLGHAYLRRGDTAAARAQFESAQRYGPFRGAALFNLAALAAHRGARDRALARLDDLTAENPDDVRAGALVVALLRNSTLTEAAFARQQEWRRIDPTSLMLRAEGIRLGFEDAGLWAHLAGDPERILEIVIDYMRFGLYHDALFLLDRVYPDNPVVSEPGSPRPAEYPLLAYYAGYVRNATGGDGGPDFDRAARMPTTYVFPNRAETFDVLLQAIDHNSGDANAHFLLGSLFLSGGMADEAMAEWEHTSRLAPNKPVLHRNMGYTALHSGQPISRAIELFLAGTEVDSLNIDNYFGLDAALEQDGWTASDRADALLSYPDPATMPARLVYETARTLAEAERFHEAEALFTARFFPSEEGGTNVREVWLDIRASRAGALADADQCVAAMEVIRSLYDMVPNLPFTTGGLEDFVAAPALQKRVLAIEGRCERR